MDGQWTEDPRRAQDFPNITAVHQAKRHHSLQDVELYLCFSEQPSQYDFSFPLN